MAMPQLRNYIDGRWVDAATRETFEDIDPATGELIATVTKSSGADVDRAVEAGLRALEARRPHPAPKPGEIFYRARRNKLRRQGELARAGTRGMGKVPRPARGDGQTSDDMIAYTPRR